MVGAAAHGSSPLELSISNLVFPKLTLTVKNTDAHRDLRLWERGTSWGDPTLQFEVFDKAGNSVGIYEPAPRSYTANFPRAYELKPGETRALEFDLSDKASWTQPANVDLNHPEGLGLQAVLNQPLEAVAHTMRVFIGEAKSPCTSATQIHGSGSCVEWNALPDHHHGPVFDTALFLEKLRKLQIHQNDSKITLLECLDPTLPWSQGAIIIAYPEFRSTASPFWEASLLLPDAVTVTFVWDMKNSLSARERLLLFDHLKLPKFGDAGKKQPCWAPASEVLPKLPARGITSVVINRHEVWLLQSDGSYQKR